MNERDGRTPLIGTLKCVKSKIISIVDHSRYCFRVVLSHDNLVYLVNKERFSEEELRDNKSERYFQLVDSEGRRSICDIV